MKNYIWIFGIVFLISCVSNSNQRPTPLGGPLEYSEITDVSSVDQAELYRRANIWAVSTFNSAESVIQYSDKDSGTLTGKYLMKMQYRGYPVNIITTIRIEVRTEKYKILFTEPQWKFSDLGSTKYKSVDTVELAIIIRPEWEKMVNSLKNTMLTNESTW